MLEFKGKNTEREGDMKKNYRTECKKKLKMQHAFMCCEVHFKVG